MKKKSIVYLFTLSLCLHATLAQSTPREDVITALALASEIKPQSTPPQAPPPPPKPEPKKNNQDKSSEQPKNTNQQPSDELRDLKDSYLQLNSDLNDILRKIIPQNQKIQQLKKDNEDDDAIEQAKQVLTEITTTKKEIEQKLQDTKDKLKIHGITIFTNLETELEIIEYEKILQKKDTLSGLTTEEINKFNKLADKLKEKREGLKEAKQKDSLSKTLLEKLEKLFPSSNPQPKDKPKDTPQKPKSPTAKPNAKTPPKRDLDDTFGDSDDDKPKPKAKTPPPPKQPAKPQSSDSDSDDN